MAHVAVGGVERPEAAGARKPSVDVAATELQREFHAYEAFREQRHEVVRESEVVPLGHRIAQHAHAEGLARARRVVPQEARGETIEPTPRHDGAVRAGAACRAARSAIRRQAWRGAREKEEHVKHHAVGLR